jgi:hypothetical protein
MQSGARSATLQTRATPRAARAVESQSESFTKSLSGVAAFVLEA